MFKDKIKLKFIAGKGGDGIIAFRRAKFVPKGGPFGGDGGKGGSIILKVDNHLISLENFFLKKKIKAEDGNPGGINNQTGRNGSDLIFKVPIGTIIKENDKILFEFLNKEDSFVICKGGKGGKGNYHFRSPTNQTPFTCTLGAAGEEKDIELDLKLIADIGLVGFPNAGKSTLMARLTNNKVKIAPYPFTTLYPNIGRIELEDFSNVFLADIPGIIKDAHLNKGLGISFLKHIERTSILLFVVDISSENPKEDFKILLDELTKYNPEILQKPKIIALNKTDLLEDLEKISDFKNKFPEYKIIDISCEENLNLSNLIDLLKLSLKEKLVNSKIHN